MRRPQQEKTLDERCKRFRHILSIHHFIWHAQAGLQIVIFIDSTSALCSDLFPLFQFLLADQRGCLRAVSPGNLCNKIMHLPACAFPLTCKDNACVSKQLQLCMQQCVWLAYPADTGNSVI